MKAILCLRGKLCLINKLLRLKHIVALLLVFLYTGAQDLVAQQTKPTRILTGTVVSAKDGKPVVGARISSPNAINTDLTDKNGNFTIESHNLKNGRIQISIIGYDKMDFLFNESSTLLKISIQPINDPFMESNGNFKALKIGEKVPDFEFAIKNYHSPTAKISDFKGKLLILDFWTTNCTVCFYSFPKMEALQKRFGDKIQIILVNVRESEEEIKTKLKNRSSTTTHQLNTMPSVISSVAMTQLFPHPFAGNYFWIDPEGILRLNSAVYINHHDDKINEVINRKEITFLTHGPRYTKEDKSLNQFIKDSPNQHMELGSSFTTMLRDYYPNGGTVLREVDSFSNTYRNAYVNKTVLSLYYLAFEKLLKNEWKSMIYGPNIDYYRNLDAFKLVVKDSSLYEHRLIPYANLTDVNTVKSEYCYEQVLPLNTSEQQATKIFRDDLDRFFGFKYGATFNIEEVLVPGYFIKRADHAPLTEKEIKKKLKHLGKREFNSTNYYKDAIDNFYRPDMSKNREPWFPYVFDVDGINNKKRKIIMPRWKKGDKLEDFILALNANGLSFTKGTQKIKKIVVRDNQ